MSTFTEIHASVCISKFNLDKFASLKGLEDKLYYRILLSVNFIIGLLCRPSTKTSMNKKVLAACILLTAPTKMISIFVLFFTPFLQLSLPKDPSTHKHKRSLRWQRLGRWCARGWCGCVIFIQDGVCLEPRWTIDHDTPPPVGQTCFPGAETSRRSREKQNVQLLSPTHNYR